MPECSLGNLNNYVLSGLQVCDILYCCSVGQKRTSAGHHVELTWQRSTRKALHCGVVKV